MNEKADDLNSDLDLAAMMQSYAEKTAEIAAKPHSKRLVKIAAAMRAKGAKGAKRTIKAVDMIIKKECAKCKRHYEIDQIVMASVLCVYCWPEPYRVDLWMKFWEQKFADAIETKNYSCSTRSSAYRGLQQVEWSLKACKPAEYIPMLARSMAGLLAVKRIRNKVELKEWKEMLLPQLAALELKKPVIIENPTGIQQLKLFGTGSE